MADADRLGDVGDRFAHNSPPEQWWMALDASKKAMWAAIQGVLQNSSDIGETLSSASG
jgi:hypothetical protein